jgi:hypothetical protein
MTFILSCLYPATEIPVPMSVSIGFFHTNSDPHTPAVTLSTSGGMIPQALTLQLTLIKLLLG